jgi:hypothetical protein
MTWLTPRRLRAATIAIMVVAFAVSSVGLGGSDKPQQQQKPSARAATLR